MIWTLITDKREALSNLLTRSQMAYKFKHTLSNDNSVIGTATVYTF